MQGKFSVLLAVYEKENPLFFEQALYSIVKQTLLPNEVVIVKDGPLTQELDTVLATFMALYPTLCKIVSLESNQGLGVALAEGVNECSYELIARMDSDDISREDRFEKQIAEFRKDSELDICGCHIAEFEGDKENIVSIRRVPSDNSGIHRYQRMRSAFNHMTVVFKKSTVLNAGNYESCPDMEDMVLFSRLCFLGARGKNLQEKLVYVRVGDDFYRRRGGLIGFLRYREGRKKIRAVGYISLMEYYISLVAYSVLALAPSRISRFIYRKILHRC